MSAASSPRALLPVADGAQIRAFVRDVLRRRWALVLTSVVAMLAESVLGMAGPIAIGWIAQAVADHRPPAALIGPAALLAATAVLTALVVWASAVLLARLTLPEVARLREDALAAAVELPLDDIEAGGVGDLVSRVSGDAERVADVASSALGSFVGSALAILATLGGLAALDWRFAVAGLLAVPIQVHTLRWYLRRSRPVYAAGRVADGRRAAALLTGFTALPTLRTLRLGAAQQQRIAEASADSMEYELQATRIATRFYGRLNLAEFVGLGAILLVAFVLVHGGLASIGSATTAALFFAGLFGPINTVLGVFDSIQQAGAGLVRLLGVATTAGPSTERATAPAGPPALRAEAVRFGYADGPDVLHDVTVDLEPGWHLAIVGATGSGKSSLASLLAGLRRPRAGEVRFAGAPIDALELPQRRVALVTQETHVFAGSIGDNLRPVRPSATDAEIADALRTVGALDWVRALPDGTDTLIGAGGHPLSAEQAQQLALARIALLDPAVVVLDEATAEAGSDAAHALDHAADAVLRGRSGVIIAHRLSQATAADRIVVMAHGRIVETGDHEELLDAGGAYATLWAAWSRPHATDPRTIGTATPVPTGRPIDDL